MQGVRLSQDARGVGGDLGTWPCCRRSPRSEPRTEVVDDVQSLRLLATGVAIGIVIARVRASCSGRPPTNSHGFATDDVTANPWLIQHGVPGSAHAEIATLEHVGRTSGTTYFNPGAPR